jgi:hypothetical protein
MRTQVAGVAAGIVSALLALVPASGRCGPLKPSPQAVVEVNYLLAATGASGCEFYRNGSWNNAQKAQSHLKMKYEWLAARDKIRTAEDFIELAATRSSQSGQEYEVRCGGAAPVSSNRWLTELLHRYREAGGAPPPGGGAPAVQSSNH